MEKLIKKNLISENIRVKGALRIKGSVFDGCNIVAGEDITIEGHVENSIIKSENGSVYVFEGVKGTKSKIEAFGDFEADYVESASVKVHGSIYVNNLSLNAKLFARNAVIVEKGDGIIEGGICVAGIDIVTNFAGSKNKTETHLEITNFRQREMFEMVIIFEQKIKQKTMRLKELEKYINVIKILGSKVTQLPPAKKKQLAQMALEYNKLKEQIAEMMQEKSKLDDENEKYKKYKRAVIVHGTVFPGTRVVIDRASFDVKQKYTKVIFYKSGIIIVGDLDKFRERMRNEGIFHGRARGKRV